MSNNIYDILKKMQNLEAPKQSLTESKKSKPDYIDIDKDGDKKEPMKKAAQEKSKGAVAEAVAQVEQQLAEKYQGFKKSVAEGVQAKGVIKPTDSGDEYTPAPGYRVKAEFEPGQTKPKMGFVKSDSEQTGQAAKPAKPAETPKVDEDALDFLRSPEGIAKNRADQARADQNFADRSAKHFAGQIGDQYHDQLMKNSPSYADEYRSRAKDMPYDKLDKLSKSLQAKHDPMGGPTNIDYEKIKKNPMSTRAGEQGVDWRPFGPGPKDSFDSDKFGRPVREGEMEESGLQAYLGKKKYGKEGMQALQKAGRDGASKEKMARIRARHDKMDEDAYNEDMLSPKQQKFAALAEPKDKITYADKIAGAKQGKKTEGNKFTGNLAKARAAGEKRADLDGDGDMEPVREGWFDDAADRAIANVNARTAREVNDEFRRSNLNPSMKSPNTDKFKTDIEQSRARGSKFYDTPEKEGPLKGRTPANILSKDAEERDIEGQNKYRDRTSPGIINKAKDFIGYDKPDSAYGPKDMKEGRTSMREGWEEMQKYLEKKRGPESKGGAGKKAGTRYGGSAQKDDDEDLDGEGRAVVKKKGRPKGTGGGAKFNFKKPKD